jgi:hypothetical protein
MTHMDSTMMAMASAATSTGEPAGPARSMEVSPTVVQRSLVIGETAEES